MNNKESKKENRWQKIADDLDNATQEEELLAAPTESPALDFPSREALEGQLTNKENELQALEGKYNEAMTTLRYTHAEFDNFRKLSERNIKNAYDFGPEKLIRDGLLGVLDSLEKSLEILNSSPNDSEAIYEGILLTQKMLMSTLEKFSVKQVNPLGEAFNPAWHEAMTTQAQEGAKPGVVLSVLQKGYTLHDRLLRPALVIVAK